MTTLTFEDGKYTYINDEQGQRALRYGEPWRDLVGDKFVYCMAAEIERLKELATRMDGQLGKRPCQNDRCVSYLQLTKQRDDLLAVVGHIRRCIPTGGFAQIHDRSATVADMDAAIDSVKGELK